MLTGSHALLCPAARHDTQIKQSNQIQFYLAQELLGPEMSKTNVAKPFRFLRCNDHHWEQDHA